MKTKVTMWLRQHKGVCKLLGTIIIIPESIIRSIWIGFNASNSELKEMWRDYIELMKM